MSVSCQKGVRMVSDDVSRVLNDVKKESDGAIQLSDVVMNMSYGAKEVSDSVKR